MFVQKLTPEVFWMLYAIYFIFMAAWAWYLYPAIRKMRANWVFRQGGYHVQVVTAYADLPNATYTWDVRSWAEYAMTAFAPSEVTTTDIAFDPGNFFLDAPEHVVTYWLGAHQVSKSTFEYKLAATV